MGIDRIYRRAVTGTHRFGIAALVLLTVLLVAVLLLVAALVVNAAYTGNGDTLVAAGFMALLLIAIAAIVVRGLVRRIVIYKIVKGRNYSGQINLKADDPAGSRAGVSVLLEEARLGSLGKKSAASFKVQIINQGQGWWLYDATSVIYGNKGMEIAERSYTVFEAKLRQPASHLVFDSKLAKKRQFRAIYSGSQQLKGVLGDQIERLFAVYSPIHHTIETLSFITPEVIEAIIGLDDCDIEFVDNSLLCYSSFLPPKRLDSFRRRCSNLHAKVNDNLRLYQASESAVKTFGRRLLKDYRRKIITGLLLAVLGLAVAILGLAVLSIEVVIQAVILASSGVKVIVSGFKTRAYNQRVEQEFLRESER